MNIIGRRPPASATLGSASLVVVLASARIPLAEKTRAEVRTSNKAANRNENRLLVAGLHLVEPAVQLADDAAVDLELLVGGQVVLVLHRADQNAFQHVRQVRDAQVPLAGRLVVPGGFDRRRPGPN